MTVPARYRDSFRIRAAETDLYGRLQSRTLCMLLQEAATAHAAALGVAVETLLERDVAWVLAELRVAMSSWPQTGDTVTIETWPSAAGRTLTERRFRLADADGKTIGSALTLWLVMDTVRRRPGRLPGFVLEAVGRVVGDAQPDALGSLPELEAIDHERALSVRYGDLDMVHHANNAAFVEWAAECVPETLRDACDPSEIEIRFLSECRLGDAVLSQGQIVERGDRTAVHHRLIRKRDGVVVARGRTVWRPRAPIGR
jgi:acyl-ACP thioesterase